MTGIVDTHYVIYVSALILNSETKKTPPLVTKSLSDEALREVKKSFKLDKINGNLCRDVTGEPH